MPQLANFSVKAVKEVFSEHGIYVLEEYPDGQIMWGNEPLTTPYRDGAFHASDCFVPGRIDIFTVRGILSKLDKAGQSSEIESKLFAGINEELE
jgi:hypothetical protein